MNITDIVRLAEDFEEAAANTQRSGELFHSVTDPSVDIKIEDGTWDSAEPKIKFASETFAEVSIECQKLSNELVNMSGQDVMNRFDYLSGKVIQIKNQIVAARKAMFGVHDRPVWPLQ